MAAETGTRTAGSTMWDRLRNLPSDLVAGYGRGNEVDLPDARFARVALLGMGGSGLAALLAARALDPEGRRVRAVRDERLPGDLAPGDLAILVSYSGDTSETLRAFEAAGARGLARAAVASGGELARRARALGLPCAALPGGSPPRAALGHLAGAALALLERVTGDLDGSPAPKAPAAPAPAGGAGGRASVERAARLLEDLHRAWRPRAAEASNLALAIAREIGGRVPLVYAGPGLLPAAERWKTQMNENAKTPAWAAYFPELGHNEIQGWEGRGVADLFHVTLLVDPEEGETGERRARTACDLLLRRKVPARIVRPPSGDRLARLLALASLADHASLHLAALRGADPEAVALIREWKERTSEETP